MGLVCESLRNLKWRFAYTALSERSVTSPVCLPAGREEEKEEEEKEEEEEYEHNLTQRKNIHQ